MCCAKMYKYNHECAGKVVFLGSNGSQEMRKKWLKAMKTVDPFGDKSKVYCCEDHFVLEEDTDNYIQYKIMYLQEKHKNNLRLKKGTLPHKFHCQKNTTPLPERQAYKKRRHLEIIKESLSASPACSTTPNLTEISQIDLIEANTSSSQIYTEDTEIKNDSEASCSASLTTKDKMYVDKAVKVNRKIYFRSKGVNVNLCVKKQNKAVSPSHILSKSISTSPLKVAHKSGLKKALIQDNPADIASVSSPQPSLLSSTDTKEPVISSPETSCLYKNECNIT